MAYILANSQSKAGVAPDGARAFALRTKRWAAAATLLLTAAATGSALEPFTPLANYSRQSWGMENGLPQNTVQALTQTRDGFVWLGTEVGLVRFDGNSFQLFDRNTTPGLPGNDVRCLLAANDDSLWIGTGDGLARWSGEAMTVFTAKDGLPSNTIVSLQADGRGGLWAGTANGWAYYDGRRFTMTRVEQAVPKGFAEFQVTLLNGARAFASKSAVEIIGANGVIEHLNIGKELPGHKIQTLFADREGNLWIGTNDGLARWAAGKVQLFPITDPLASASILVLLEDSEGDLWAGTEFNGLHILRDQRFKALGTRDGLTSDATTAVVEDAGGTLWVGTAGSGLNAIGPAKSATQNGTGASVVRSYSARNGLASDVILSLAASPNGDVWVGTPDGLNRIRAGTIASFTSADGLPDDFIRSLLVDSDASLWIGTRRGLTHWPEPGSLNTRIETFTHAKGLGSDLVGAMTRDAHGDLWIATFAGLSRLRDNRIENFTTANGLSSNVITALLARKNKTLVIGTQDHGWNLWNGQRLIAAEDGSEDKPQTAIHAILDDGSGHLWFATGAGLTRGDCPEITADENGLPQRGCSNWIVFGAADGLRGLEEGMNSHPSAWRSRNGLLWFATPRGLIEADPAHFPVNTVAPPVAMERFSIDDVPQALRAANVATKIPAGHVHFEFDYAGLSFVAPQKVRYRYMLEGFDHDWTDAGTRRTVYYTNIPPGRYIFRAQAANNDGVWNAEGTALRFELRPHFYQMLWFYAVLAVFVVGLVLLVQRLRLLRAEREFNAVLGERNRIAREIHDTLAQGYVGISVQLEVLSELLRIHKVDAAAKHLDLTRGFVREGLADARQSIWALRSQDSDQVTLPVRIRRAAEAAGNSELDAQFSLYGAYHPLSAKIEREILRVAQEAIHNVKKHARAKSLFVQLRYGAGEIALEVRDDGRGFAAGEKPHSPPGHYGLTGMQERAAVIGGSLEVASAPGAGTTVRLIAKGTRETKEVSGNSPTEASD